MSSQFVSLHHHRHPARRLHVLHRAQNLRLALRQRLAAFIRDRERQLVAVLLQQRLQPEQRLHAIHHRRPPPLHKRALRHLHRRVHVRRRRKGNLRQHLGRCRVDHVQRFARARPAPIAFNKILQTFHQSPPPGNSQCSAGVPPAVVRASSPALSRSLLTLNCGCPTLAASLLLRLGWEPPSLSSPGAPSLDFETWDSTNFGFSFPAHTNRRSLFRASSYFARASRTLSISETSATATSHHES